MFTIEFFAGTTGHRRNRRAVYLRPRQTFPSAALAVTETERQIDREERAGLTPIPRRVVKL